MRAPVASRLLCLALVAAPLAAAPAAEKPDPAEVFAALPLREIGPALASGRVADLAVDAERPWRWLVGVASGGVWSTENAGASWTPLFDREGSFSIGAVAVDPNDPLVYWVGTGENNGQRSVAYGDGVYKSIDGGRSWKNVGLGDSQHVGKILVDPRDSDVVWVAAQGPLWNGGGDRGLYKTTDGGATWTKSLAISDDTGVSDVVFHPQDPDTLYATAWQRRRHVWTVVSGGPEGAVYKSTDGGASWRKVAKGLPEVDLGRIGLAVTPAAPDWVYAVVEAANGEGGFYRSTDRGESWEKRSGYVPGGPQYYNELVADPKNPLRVYSMDVWIHVTDDGGKSFRELGEWNKHSDNHALWIDPAATDHLVVGCDGGLYETFDGGKKWRWIENLPTVQFYKVAVDDREPFYHVYGGTQDNFTLGGPARTPWQHGIRNSDWRVIVDGDGFQAQAEPGNPDVVYAQAQYANLVRMDLASGDQTFIQPQAEPGEAPLRWNWDSPLVVSPHSPTRLYYAAQHVFRSDDRGDRWRPVSPDLTRQVDRDALPVMGRIQVADAVAKSGSTSPYGNVVALAESRRVEGLLYAGPDDGLVQVSEDGGGSWRRIERFPGVPERAYVRDLVPSAHDADVVYAALEDHKSGDFRPFVLKSSDRGRTWRSIAANLPEKGSVYALAEDPVDARLLFAGTEFGLWASQDGGAKWFRLKGGLPTIQVRDLAIQEREGDLVVATFGRGFWVLDDLSPLRTARAADLEGEAMLFPVRDALAYVEQLPLGYPDKSFQGDGFYTAANPPYGALLTIYLRDEIRSKKDARHAAEAEALEAKREAPYPKPEALVVEAEEEAPTLVVTISDASGAVVRRLRVEPKAGLQRVAWDLRWPAATPARLAEPPRKNAYDFPARGPLAAPGRYTATLAKRVDGVTTPLGEPRTFEVVPAGAGALPAADRAVLGRFVAETAALQRAALGASSLAGETAGRLVLLARALDDAGAGAEPVRARVAAAVGHLREIRKSLEGDSELARRSIAQAPALLDRINHAVAAHYSSIAAPTGTARRQVELASTELGAVIDALRRLVESDLPALEAEADRLGAPLDSRARARLAAGREPEFLTTHGRTPPGPTPARASTLTPSEETMRSASPLVLAVAASFAAAAAPAATITAKGDPPAASGGDLAPAAIERSVADALDRAADPCQDFYRFACGGWIDSAELPADQPIWTRSFSIIHEQNRELLRTLIESAAKDPGGDPDRRRVGRFYAACTDAAAVEKAGLAPLAPWLAKIDAAADRDALFALAGELQTIAATPFFDVEVDGDFKDPRTVVAHFSQGGLGMPERDYYLAEDEKKAAVRAAYEEHVARMLVHLGANPERAAEQAKGILEFETRLAEASRPAERMRVYDELHHRLDAGGLEALTPKLPWPRFFAAGGRADLEAINVGTPEFFVELERQIGLADVEMLRAYLRYQLITATAPALTDAVYQDHFDFYARTLSGQQEPQPRWKRCISATEQAMGEAVGKLYVAERFTGESKRIAEKMLDDVAEAFSQSLPGLAWMDETTRRAALVKKGTLGRKIGYPDVWRDYSKLEVSGDDYFGNVVAARKFETARQLAQVGGPIDPKEWGMNAQTVNASYNPLLNSFTYPAGILQPPFFHKDFPLAMNYGAMGYVMGHELTHGFDDQGRKFDAEGRLTDWWTPASVEGFEARAACVEKQYDAYEVEPGVHVNGALTLGENIGDIGGMKQAWDAYKAVERANGRPEPAFAGLSSDQLFFVAAAQVWCTEVAPEFFRLLVQTDPHSPSQFRVNGTVINHPAFGPAFFCAAGTPMNPKEKCEVW